MSGTNDLDSLERELAGTGYRVVRALARSAMSDVVVVRRDGQVGEQVLKVVRAPKLGDEDAGADLARRLLAEARALRVLVHPNIVRLLDFGLTAPSGDAGGRPYLVTELLSGRTLSDEVATRRRLPPAEAVGVVLDVLQALDSGHARGLVHRDLKPPNIFYTYATATAPRVVKLLDFGIAKAVNDEARARAGSALVATRKGYFIGSPSFMAPEQALAGEVDGRTDLYAVGAMLFFLLTGQPLFRGRSEEIVMGHLVGEPPSLRALAPEVPDALDAIVRRALSKAPDDRFPTALAMWRELVSLGFDPTTGRSAAAPHAPTRAADRGVEVASTMRSRTPDDTDETRLPRHAADADTAIEPLLDPDAEVQPRLVSADPPYPTQPMEQTPALSKAREGERTAVWMGAAVLILLLLVAGLAWLALQPRPDPPPAIGGGPPESPSIARSYLLPSVASAMLMSEPLQPFGHDTIPQSVIERLRTGKFEAPELASGAFADTVPVSARAAHPAPLDEAERLRTATEPLAPDATRARVPARYGGELDFKPGERFRGLTVEGHFATGGLSLLYAAKSETGKDVLIKLLKPAYRGLEPRMRVLQDKLVAEGELLLSVEGKSPHLVRVYDVGVDPKLGPFVVMERLRGKTLGAFIRAQKDGGPALKLRVVVELGIAIARALHSMHLLGAVHRDIKPDNLFVCDDMRVVLIDWGAAKSVYSPNTAFVEEALGTPRYMPPEQLSKDVITGAVDQYALVTVIYELLFQHPLADELGKLPDVPALCHRQLHWAPRTPPAYAIPPKLWAILERGMAKKFQDRWPSCDRLAEALEAWKAAKETADPRPPELLVPVRPTVPRSRPEPRVREARPDPVRVLTPAPRIGAGVFSDKASLFVRSGACAGARFEIEKRVVIGRHPAHAHVVLEDPGISNAHCALEVVVQDVDAPVWNLVDLGSQNGTAIGGIRLEGTLDDELASVSSGRSFVIDDVEICLMPAGRRRDDGTWQTRSEATAEAQALAKRELANAPQIRTEKMPSSPAPPRAKAALGARPTPARPRALAYRHELELTDRWSEPTVLILGDGKARRFHLDATGVIGASPDRANIVIDHPEISGAHVRYTHVTGRHRADLVYSFEDLGSTNGTFGFDAHGKVVRASVHTLRAGCLCYLARVLPVLLLPPGGFLTPPAEGGIDLRSFRAMEPAPDKNSRPERSRRSIPAITWVHVGTFLIVVLAATALALLALIARQRGLL